MNVKGFNLEVTMQDGVSNVLVSLKDETIINTNKVSIEGLRNLAAVCETAADEVYQALDYYWACRHERDRVAMTAAKNTK
jgi:hypothetical protein